MSETNKCSRCGTDYCPTLVFVHGYNDDHHAQSALAATQAACAQIRIAAALEKFNQQTEAVLTSRGEIAVKVRS